MNEFRLELSGITCESCGKMIGKIAERNGAALKEIDFRTHSVILSCEPERIGALKKELADKGYPEKGGELGSRGRPERIVKYVRAIIAGEPHVAVESRLLNYALGSAALMIVLGALAYAAILGQVPEGDGYVPLLLLAATGAVVTTFTYSHMACYRKSLSCMNGMMVGMTVGMISGFMAGALIGATNGMFMGSVAGMAVGISLGVSLGACCGITGAMEGIMAGLMAGIMGAMTSVMMIGDNLVAFLYIAFGICTVVLGGLSYLMFREAGAAQANELRSGFPGFFAVSGAFALVLSGIMILGPKGLLVYP